tara:strand:+ start:310 stop:438 length:129 start_codon:yes stop_codon:yes gene_type:complete
MGLSTTIVSASLEESKWKKTIRKNVVAGISDFAKDVAATSKR